MIFLCLQAVKFNQMVTYVVLLKYSLNEISGCKIFHWANKKDPLTNIKSAFLLRFLKILKCSI